MLKRLLFVLTALGVFARPALAIDPYVRKHATGVITAGAPCAGDAITTDQQTCSSYFCNGSTWVQCSTGTGPGTSCSGAFTSNRVVKASSTGTACAFVNSAISEDGTTVCVISEDLGVVNDKWVFWDSVCSAATVKDAGIRWDTGATPDEFDFDADGTTRENLRAILSGTNAALAGHSGAVDRTVDSSTYTTTPSAGTYRGRDIAGTVTVQASGGGGAAGTNLVTNNPSFSTGTLLDQDGWHELEVNLSIRDTTTFATTPAALRFDGDGSRAGNSESRPGANGGPPGAAYYSLTTGTTYRLTVQSRQNSAGGNQDLRWTIHLFNGASDAVPAYSLQSSGGTPTTLIAGDIAANNFSRFVVTNAASFNPYTIDFLLDPGSSGASGTYLATVHFRRPDFSTAYSFWVDDVELAPVVSNIDTNLTIVGLATDQFVLAPATTVSGDAVSAVALIGVHAKPKLAPVFPASGTATITSAEGVRAGVAYTADADGTTTVMNAASGFFETPAVGSSKYAAMFEGTAGWGTYAAASCVTRDSADHLYGDLDCDSTKDAGEEFLDLAAGASNSFVTIDTTSGTDPVADSATDTLTLTAGTGITITGNSATDAVTIASTGVGGSGTLNTIPKWTPDGVTLGNSRITDDGATPIVLGGNITASGNLVPNSTATKDLGSASVLWRRLYVSSLNIANSNLFTSTLASGSVAFDFTVSTTYTGGVLFRVSNLPTTSKFEVGPTGDFNVTQGTLTSAYPALYSQATWNNSATTFKHWWANVTNTASAADSLLVDLQVGLASKFSVDKTGLVTTAVPIPVTSGGTSLATLISNSIYKGAGTSAPVVSDLSDDGTDVLTGRGSFKSSVAAAGPAFKFNTANTITGNLFDFQNNATSRFKQTGVGTIAQTDTETATGSNDAYAITQTITASGATTKAFQALKVVQPVTLTGSTNNTVRLIRYEPTLTGSTSSTNSFQGFSIAPSITGTVGGVTLYSAALTGVNATGAVTLYKGEITLNDGTKGNVNPFDVTILDGSTATITTPLVAGYNMGAGSWLYGVGSSPVVAFRQGDQTGASTNVKGFAVSHDSTLLNGQGIGWVAALDTAFSAASTSWIGTTDGTSRTLKAEGGIVYDNCGAIASASSIAVNSCNTVSLTGSTTVNTITACNAANSGRMLVVMCGSFTGTICDEVVDGVTCGAAGNLRLQANFVCTADDTLSLVCDGTNWLGLGAGSAN